MALVVLDERSGEITVVHPEIASRRFLPASTFKIPNTLIGLETGVIPDEHFTQKWNGTHYAIEEWNRDQDLESAMRNSVVWYYQEVARRIGPERMRDHLHRFRYGNEDIGGGIDRFWLDGALRISPREQVDFLHRLRSHELPVSNEHVAVLERMLANETIDGVTMRWKTGLADDVGWMVGWITSEKSSHTFACAMTGAPEETLKKLRLEIPREELGRLGIIPKAMAASRRWN
jgi:beta-lactamase class D